GRAARRAGGGGLGLPGRRSADGGRRGGAGSRVRGGGRLRGARAPGRGGVRALDGRSRTCPRDAQRPRLRAAVTTQDDRSVVSDGLVAEPRVLNTAPQAVPRPCP